MNARPDVVRELVLLVLFQPAFAVPALLENRTIVRFRWADPVTEWVPDELCALDHQALAAHHRFSRSRGGFRGGSNWFEKEPASVHRPRSVALHECTS